MGGERTRRLARPNLYGKMADRSAMTRRLQVMLSQRRCQPLRRQHPRYPKADVVVARICRGFGAKRWAQRFRRAEPGSATHGPRWANGLRVGGTVGGRAGIAVGKAVLGPLPDIADQVEQAECIGL